MERAPPGGRAAAAATPAAVGDETTATQAGDPIDSTAPSTGATAATRRRRAPTSTGGDGDDDDADADVGSGGGGGGAGEVLEEGGGGGGGGGDEAEVEVAGFGRKKKGALKQPRTLDEVEAEDADTEEGGGLMRYNFDPSFTCAHKATLSVDYDGVPVVFLRPNTAEYEDRVAEAMAAVDERKVSRAAPCIG